MDFIGTYLSFCWLFSGCFCNFLFSFLPFFFLSFLVIWWLYLVLGLDSFFFCLCIYYRFWVCDFPRSCISLVAFQIPSLSFIFFILITMCLSMDLFRLIRYRTLCSSWTWMIVSFLRLKKFSLFPQICQEIFPVLNNIFFSLFSCWDCYTANVIPLDAVEVLTLLIRWSPVSIVMTITFHFVIKEIGCLCFI